MVLNKVTVRQGTRLGAGQAGSVNWVLLLVPIFRGGGDFLQGGRGLGRNKKVTREGDSAGVPGLRGQRISSIKCVG